MALVFTVMVCINSTMCLHHVISVTRASELPRRLRRTAVSDMQARLSLQRVQRHMRDLRLSAAHRVKQVRTINALSSCTCISLEYFPAQVDAGRGFPAQVDADVHFT